MTLKERGDMKRKPMLKERGDRKPMLTLKERVT